MPDPERLTHQRVYDGKVFAVDRDRVRMPNGREVTVDVVRHSKSVVLIPIPERPHKSSILSRSPGVHLIGAILLPESCARSGTDPRAAPVL